MVQTTKYSKKDVAISRSIAWYIVLTVICVFGRELLRFVNIPDIFFTFLRFFVSAVLVLLALRYIRGKGIIWGVIFEIIFGLSYIYAYIMGYTIQSNMSTYCITTFLLCIPYAVFMYYIDNLDCLYNMLLKASYFNLVILALYIISTSSIVRYSMPASYQVLFCLLLHTNELFKNDKQSKRKYVILVSIELLLILLHGARGPLLCFAVYLIVSIFTEARMNKKAKVAVIIGVIFAALIVINYNTVLRELSNILSQYKIDSRTINALITDTIFEDSGRSAFQKRSIDLITANPLIGYGASSDVKLLGGQYAHNLFLELCMDFGLIVGLGISVWITISVLKSLFVKTSKRKELLLIFACLGYVMLMFSGTYLQSIYLFMFMGLATRKDCTSVKKAGVL